MKRLIITLLGALLLCSCGVGSYSVSSGKADEAMLSFVSPDKTPITVSIDNGAFSYDIETVKTKAWQKNRNIKKTAQNTICLSPGQHDISVTAEGKEICHKKVFISAQEHKVIEL